MRCIDQKAARQQRHQRQHIEIDAVGARQRIALRRLIITVADQRARRQYRRQAHANSGAVCTIGQFEIDPVDPAKPPETGLRRSNIDDPQPPSFGDRRQYATHDHGADMAVGTDRQAIANPNVRRRERCARQQQRIFGKWISAARTGAACSDANRHWCHVGRAQDIQPEQRNRHTTRIDRLEHHHRAGIGNALNLRNPSVKRLVKPARARCKNLEIGCAVDRPDRLAERTDRRAVDEVHGKPQRDADGNRDHRHRNARGMLPPFAPDHPADGKLRHPADGKLRHAPGSALWRSTAACDRQLRRRPPNA